jgi:hypothetical protein
MTTNPKPRNLRELHAVMATGEAQRNQALQKLLMQEGIISMRGAFVGSTAMRNDDVDFTIAGVAAALRRLFQLQA